MTKYGAVGAKVDAIAAGLSHYVKKGKTVVPDDKRIAKAGCHLSNYLTEEGTDS